MCRAIRNKIIARRAQKLFSSTGDKNNITVTIDPRSKVKAGTTITLFLEVGKISTQRKMSTIEIATTPKRTQGLQPIKTPPKNEALKRIKKIPAASPIKQLMPTYGWKTKGGVLRVAGARVRIRDRATAATYAQTPLKRTGVKNNNIIFTCKRSMLKEGASSIPSFEKERIKAQKRARAIGVASTKRSIGGLGPTAKIPTVLIRTSSSKNHTTVIGVTHDIIT